MGPAELVQAVTAGVVAGGTSFSGVFYWARSIGHRLERAEARINAEPGGLAHRLTIIEQQMSEATKADSRIEAAVAALHRRLDEHQQSDQADRLRVAERLGELTAEVRRGNGREGDQH